MVGLWVPELGVGCRVRLHVLDTDTLSAWPRRSSGQPGCRAFGGYVRGMLWHGSQPGGPCPDVPRGAISTPKERLYAPLVRPGRCPLTCIAAVTASGFAMVRLPFWGVLHCAPLP